MHFRAENLIKYLGGRQIIDGISLTINQEEIVGLLGPNGAGKTTTFRMLVGLLHPDRGNIYLEEEDITFSPLYLRARKGLGYLPQASSIFRKLTVEDNFRAILEFFSVPQELKENLLESTIKEMGLENVRRQVSYLLSGGERRKVEIGRVLLLSPRFLLLDEPFTGIDPLGVQDIQNILRRLKNKGIGVVISDHNVKDTLKITDEAYLISQGQITCQGTPEELVNDPKAQELYFGESFNL